MQFSSTQWAPDKCWLLVHSLIYWLFKCKQIKWWLIFTVRNSLEFRFTGGKSENTIFLEIAIFACTKFPLTQEKLYLSNRYLTSTYHYKYHLYLLTKHCLCHREFSGVTEIINICSSSTGGKESIREERTLELGLAGWMGVFQVDLGKESCPWRKDRICKDTEQ